MAETEGTHTQQMPTNESNEVVKEKCAKHYTSNHQILLVGEGDFSFSLSLAMCFGSASNIVASSLDTYDYLIKKYKNAKANLDILGNFGAKLLHGVCVIKMKNHTDLRMRKFDRIVFNFPHSGFSDKECDHYTIMSNKNLVQSFLWNARCLLLPKGEIHVTHKTSYPYSCWNIEELAIKCGLTLVECVEFNIEDYPGYNNKIGDNENTDLPFPLGKCSTSKFMVSANATKTPPEFPFETELKNMLHMNPVGMALLAPMLIRVTECFLPDLSDLPDDSDPSSSGVGTSEPHN